MIWTTATFNNIGQVLTQAGLPPATIRGEQVLLKINLARPPHSTHPRTDAQLLRSVLQYCLDAQAQPTLCERTNGCLAQNLAYIGILEFLHAANIPYLEIDDQETVTIQGGQQQHHLPKMFAGYAYRLALPCASKREQMRFSNNVGRGLNPLMLSQNFLKIGIFHTMRNYSINGFNPRP